MKTKTRFASALGALLLSGGWLASAQATPFFIDDFQIDRNAQAPWFLDTFDNGTTPPDAGGWIFPSGRSASYVTRPNPLPGPESGGKLKIDPFDAPITSSGLTGEPQRFQRARLATNTSNNPDFLGRGLKDDDTFKVIATFDLIAPTVLGERYGVRLNDHAPNNPNPNDTVEVDVRRNQSGDVVVEFREQDVPNHKHSLIDSILLTASALGIFIADFVAYDQIALMLERPTVTSEISGSFSLIDTDGPVSDLLYNFSGTAAIFEGERFTRAEFIAGVPVPEPATFALLVAGLVGLAFFRNAGDGTQGKQAVT